jgi:scyllo-inosose 3-dehydrogenase
LNLEQVPEPQPRADELLIRVRYCGLCGSDFHLAAGSYPGLAALPVTIGHEFSGTVAAHGPGTPREIIQAFPVGSPVTAEEMHWCGHCNACRSGHLNHCESLDELGFTVDGAHGELISVHAKYCWSLSELEKLLGEEKAYRLGALVEPYSVSFRALFQGAHKGGWLPGSRVLVIGCGPIGLAAIDLAMVAGASEVVGVEPDRARRELGKKIGATKVISPAETGSLAGTFDWILDAAGAGDSLATLAERNLSIGGTICLLARTDDKMPVAPESLIVRNARIVGSQGHSGEGTFGRVIRLMAHGRLRALELVEEVISLEEACSRLKQQRKCGGKILVRPS